jgi:hypothetical protein
LIPAFAKQAVYFAKADEFRPLSNPPAPAPEVIDGFGVGFVAALAGAKLEATRATATSATALFLRVKVIGKG